MQGHLNYGTARTKHLDLCQLVNTMTGVTNKTSRFDCTQGLSELDYKMACIMAIDIINVDIRHRQKPIDIWRALHDLSVSTPFFTVQIIHVAKKSDLL